VECNHTNGKEIIMDARVDYGNPTAAKFAKHINSAGAVVYVLEMAGDWSGAAAAWEGLGRPYDAALARLGSEDEAALRQALAALDDLGARAAAAVARRRMKSLGITAIPRGPRPGTQAGPAGLTARERDVLMLLSEGLSDREISQRLFISERTVGHHVLAVLAKIGVSSRTAAAREAARMGLQVPT
jgi:DNA-binding CsgD family transcriptional regulator